MTAHTMLSGSSGGYGGAHVGAGLRSLRHPSQDLWRQATVQYRDCHSEQLHTLDAQKTEPALKHVLANVSGAV